MGGFYIIGLDFCTLYFNLRSGILSNFPICKNVLDIKWIYTTHLGDYL